MGYRGDFIQFWDRVVGVEQLVVWYKGVGFIVGQGVRGVVYWLEEVDLVWIGVGQVDFLLVVFVGGVDDGGWVIGDIVVVLRGDFIVGYGQESGFC